MTRLISLICLIGLICPIDALGQKDLQLKFPFVGKPTRDDVNIRAGYDQNFEILTKANGDDTLFVIEQSYGWYKVKLPNSAHCYVAKDFIEKNDKEAASKVSNLNVRARPNKESSIIGRLKKGDAVTVLAETEDGWYEILPPEGSYGWVRSDFLEPQPCSTPGVEHGPKPVRENKPVEKPKKKRFLWW